MSVSDVKQIDRRRIEAEILAEVHTALRGRLGEAEALDVIREATGASTHKAGAAFALAAPGGPSLEHFATVVEIWKAGGALDIEGMRLADGVLSFTVTRCSYASLYIDEMGLSNELAEALSCSRDAAFAAGYSPHLGMSRPVTIATGGDSCRFEFRWGA